MNQTVLFVDDEPNILTALHRQFLDESVTVLTAPDGRSALDYLRCSSISVIVSDNMMPGMSGIELLKQAKDISPDTVRILLTAHADASAAIQAINSGEVYKFLTKPWDPDEVRHIVRDAISRHHTVSSLRRADESMLRSLAQTIELKDSYTKGHCDRVADHAVAIAAALNLRGETLQHIKYGSWLHDCGKIGVAEAILNHPGGLSPDQMAVIRNHPRWGADVAALAQLPEPVINIILYHHEHFDGKGYPCGLAGTAIPLEARIVTIADTFDAMITDRPYRKGIPVDRAWKIMNELKGSLLDPEIADVFLRTAGFPGNPG